MTGRDPAHLSGEATPEDTLRKCPYCHVTFIQGEDVIACKACHSLHHAECWGDNSGCSVMGCSAGPSPSGARPAAVGLPPLAAGDRRVVVQVDEHPLETPPLETPPFRRTGNDPKIGRSRRRWPLVALASVVVALGATLYFGPDKLLEALTGEGGQVPMASGRSTLNFLDIVSSFDGLASNQVLLPNAASGQQSEVTVVWDRPRTGSIGFVAEAARSAAPGDLFGPSRKLTQERVSYWPVVASSSNGEAQIAWVSAEGEVDSQIEAATWPVGGSAPEATEKISEPGAPNVFPSIAVSENGDTTITWTRFEEGFEAGEGVVQVATRRAGEAEFSEPVDVSGRAGNNTNPVIASSPAGDTTIAWVRNVKGEGVIEAAFRPAGEASFSAPVNVSGDDGSSEQPVLATLPDGGATLAWVQKSGEEGVIQAATREGSEISFSEPVDVSGTKGSNSQVTAAASPRGDVSVAWSNAQGSNDGAAIFAATKADGDGEFSSSQELSDSAGRHSLPVLAYSPDGQLNAVWTRLLGSDNIGTIEVAIKPDGSESFEAPETISGLSKDSRWASMLIDSDGSATVTWVTYGVDFQPIAIKAVTRQSSEGEFSTPVGVWTR